MIQKVSVVGLGKLGACMAGCFAAKGFPTLGVDANPQVVAVVNAGQAPVDETDLPETMVKGKNLLSATQGYDQAVLNSDATFVIVPTPSLDHGGFSVKFVKEAFREIGRALAKKERYHLIVLTSTVLPGGTEYELLPILEETSGKECGVDFGLCYSPEFIALGSVIRDFLNPDFVLIGQSDDRAGRLLASFYEKICDNDPPIARMNLVNAELTKMAVNSFMTMKISFANMLSAFCEKLPGGDVDVVTNALSLFGGVGKKSLRGGLGYGGPCLPRDNVALSYLAKSLGNEISLPAAVDQFNRSLVGRLADMVLKEIPAGGHAVILGVSYKPFTWVIEESQGLELAWKLSGKGVNLTVFDPKAMEEARRVLPKCVVFANTLDNAIRDMSMVILTTPDPAFKRLPFILSKQDRRVTVIDAWRFLQKELSQRPEVKYIPLGVGPLASNSLGEKMRQLSK